MTIGRHPGHGPGAPGRRRRPADPGGRDGGRRRLDQDPGHGRPADQGPDATAAPLNSSGVAGGYFIDWTMIPLAGADRVEVIKGVGDPRYGNVLGGVINLVPKRLRRTRPGPRSRRPERATNGDLQPVITATSRGRSNTPCPGAIPGATATCATARMHLGSADLHLGYDFAFKGRLTADVGLRRRPRRVSPSPTGPRSSSAIRSTASLSSRFPGLGRRDHVRRHGGHGRAGQLVGQEEMDVRPGLRQAFGERAP